MQMLCGQPAPRRGVSRRGWRRESVGAAARLGAARGEIVAADGRSSPASRPRQSADAGNPAQPGVARREHSHCGKAGAGLALASLGYGSGGRAWTRLPSRLRGGGVQGHRGVALRRAALLWRCSAGRVATLPTRPHRRCLGHGRWLAQAGRLAAGRVHGPGHVKRSRFPAAWLQLRGSAAWPGLAPCRCLRPKLRGASLCRAPMQPSFARPRASPHRGNN